MWSPRSPALPRSVPSVVPGCWGALWPVWPVGCGKLGTASFCFWVRIIANHSRSFKALDGLGRFGMQNMPIIANHSKLRLWRLWHYEMDSDCVIIASRSWSAFEAHNCNVGPNTDSLSKICKDMWPVAWDLPPAGRNAVRCSPTRIRALAVLASLVLPWSKLFVNSAWHPMPRGPYGGGFQELGTAGSGGPQFADVCCNILQLTGCCTVLTWEGEHER